MFGICSFRAVPLDPTLNSDEGKPSIEDPGFWLRRDIKGELADALSPLDWEHSYNPKLGLLTATHTSEIGTFTLTSLKGAVSLFLDSEGATYGLGYLFGGGKIGSDIQKLAGELCDTHEQYLNLVNELPALVNLPIKNPAGRTEWLLSQTEKGCYLELSTDSGSLRISCDPDRLADGPYSVGVRSDAGEPTRDLTQWVQDSPAADAAVRKLFVAARASDAWLDHP